MTRSRLGVVLPIPDPEAAEIDGLRRALGDPALLRIPPHITLVPPVNVPDERLPDVLAQVQDAAADTSPMRLELGPVATFWPDTPVLYLAVGGDVDAVRRLRERLLVGSIGRPSEWPYVPHVTVGQDVAADLIEPAVALLRAYQRSIAVDRVHLLRQADERRWEVLAGVPLGGGRIIGRGGLEVEVVSSEVLDLQAVEFLRRAAPGEAVFAVAARREGQIVGVAIGRTDGTELVLDQLVVDAAARLQGIGSHLLREVEAIGRDRGCTSAIAIVSSGGASQGWLAARGWAVHPGEPSGQGLARTSKPIP